MIAQNEKNQTHKQSTSATTHGVTTDQSALIGFCLGCGARVSRCGVPFSGDVTCPSCAAINVYMDSQQPCRLADAATRR